MKPLLFPIFLFVLTCPLLAESIATEAQDKLDEKIAEIKVWAAQPAIIQTVAKHNAVAPADHRAMTQQKWSSLPASDPFVQSFIKNPAGRFLKARRAAWWTEAFLSDAHGAKVAFVTKPTNWSHRGKPKHEEPMSGKVWQGPVELDESTGVRQIQIAVPIFSREQQPIGSLVVGIPVSKLE